MQTTVYLTGYLSIAAFLRATKHCAQDESGKVDVFRKKRIAKIGSIVLKLQTGQG
jgi:hypothetical protein